MLNDLLDCIQKVRGFLDENDIPYTIVTSDNDAQSMMVAGDIDRIKDKLLPLVDGDFVVELKKVRSGALMTISKKAISELDDLQEVANKIVESQIFGATTGMSRSRQRRSTKSSVAGDKEILSKRLNEALDGIASPGNVQPNDLFKKFAEALAVLGSQLGIGPIQNLLNDRGVKWKKSKDGLAIIFYIMNAETNTPQPIARINYETLLKPNDFGDALMQMLDFAKGDAPGAFKQKQEAIRSQEKAVREVSNALSQPKEPANPVEALNNG